MRRHGPARWAARHCRGGPDAGTTLVEVLVSMSIMSVFMAMFTTGIVQMHRSVTIQESMAVVQSRINIAFQRLDKELRYAAGFRAPGQSAAGVPYVEYLTSAAGDPLCTQLRLTGETLQMRTWNPRLTTTPAAVWRPLVSGVAAGGGAVPQPAPTGRSGPFAFWTADATRAYQRLRVSLTASAGRHWNETERESAITFTALNSSAETDSTGICPAPRP